jgi:predicted lipid-binding transport protein (Tim44 family)
MMFVGKRSLVRAFVAVLAVAASAALVLDTADARSGGGKNSGSRGSQTYSAPPTTNTAPRAAQPIQRSTVQPGAAQAGRGVAAAGASRFGSGFGGLLLGGLLGAGLFGLLSGSGLFGGAASMAGMLGLLLQVALIGGLIWLAMSLFRRRQAVPAAGPMARQSYQQPAQHASTPAGGFAAPAAAAAAAATQPLDLAQEDYQAFERLLVRIQDAYGREDIASLRAVASPEMANYFAEDIAENQRRNRHNLVSDAKLLQGDLSEAWREADAEYATVSMRFSIVDTVVERGTGRILEGNSDMPVEATEFWTFMRRTGGNANAWRLSAIQQAG